MCIISMLSRLSYTFIFILTHLLFKKKLLYFLDLTLPSAPHWLVWRRTHSCCSMLFVGFFSCSIICLCSSMSTAHAIFISTMSLYFVFWSDLYSDHLLAGAITFRSSHLSSFALGVSINSVSCSVLYDLLTDSFFFLSTSIYK